MALVMLAEQQPLVPVVIRRKALQLFAQQPLLKQLLLDPDRQRDAKRAQAAWRESEIGFEQALEFEERLVVEDDVIDRAKLDLGLVQAILDGVARKPGVVLLAGEALLLRRRDDPAIGDERRGAVMVEGRDAKYVQRAA